VDDTIAAISTAPGRGGIGIVRLSGPACVEIATAVAGCVPEPRTAELHSFRDVDGRLLDRGLALFFPGSHSYTGEDVLELHAHGGPVVLDMLLGRVLALGARHAEPGEFTQRAFLNNKLDLAQAEAVIDLIDSGSAQAARAAARSLRGDFSSRVRDLSERVLELRIWVEAAIDFPEEEVDFLAAPDLRRRMQSLRDQFDELSRTAQQGALLRDGLTLVIAGRPNAGKSSLLNRLAGYEAAIVTATPGTTRDVLRERIDIDGLPVHVLDTAGLRESDDEAEIEGVRRARREIERADRILFVVDAGDAEAVDSIERDMAALPFDTPRTIVFNKIDCLGEPPRIDAGPVSRVHASARTGAGLDLLRSHLKACVGFHPSGGDLSARQRHLDALRRARMHALAAYRLHTEQHAGELVAQELNDAHRELGEITGQVSSDELLGQIFSSFCIGK
jgi:tRNA modification GTPase